MKYWDKAITITSGCTKVSPACQNCWAEKNHNRFLRKIPRYNHDFSEVRVHPENINIPDHIRKPTVFAVWNDLFHPKVSFNVIDDFLEMVNRNCQHTFLICTKRPRRMAEWVNRKEGNNFRFLADTHKIWLGTTIENQVMANKRIFDLIKCKPFKLFLSIEPLLEQISFYDAWIELVDQVIVGCESGRKARETKLEWVEDLRKQCLKAEVPLWVKQLKVNGKMVYNHPLSTIKKEELWK